MRSTQKRFFIILISTLVLLLLSLVYFFIQYKNPRNVLSFTQVAKAAEIDKYIERFSAEVEINNNSLVNITETIIYNFGLQEKHGIYREIPYKYQTAGGTFTVDLDVIKVTDENLNPINYKASKNRGNVVIKIGEADKYVTGIQTYKIIYSLKRVINFFAEHDEFYWNVTGHNWEVPIDQAEVIISLPAQIREQDLQYSCFTGTQDSQAKNCSIDYKNSQAIFKSYNILSPGQSLTVVLGWPKDVVTQPSFLTILGWILKDNLLVFLPIITFLIMFILWNYYGRDLGPKKTIIPYYDPPNNLTPAELGTLIDEVVNTKDISATFIDLAVRGYIKIKELPNRILGKKDWELIKLKDFNSLTEWEKDFAEKVFENKDSIKISKLKNEFYRHFSKLKKGLYNKLVEKKYFPKSPQKTRTVYIVIALALMICGIVVLPFFGGGLNILFLIISGIIVIWLGSYMPRKTVSGTEAYQKILGYKLYLKVAEKDRINFHNAPAKTPEVFEKNLPYAMVLGVEKKWAKQFENIYIKEPAWYQGNLSGFNSVVFVNSLYKFNTVANSAVVTSASSGGSGFSGGGVGGGFGGGGGGSW